MEYRLQPDVPAIIATEAADVVLLDLHEAGGLLAISDGVIPNPYHDPRRPRWFATKPAY